MTDETPTPRRRNVADLYRGAAATAAPTPTTTRKLKPLKPLKRDGDSKPETRETIRKPSPGERTTARRSQRNPHAGRPVVSVRMSAQLLQRFEEACESTGMTPLELTLTAVATALPELPEHIAKDNATKQAPGSHSASSVHSIGGLFELPDRQRPGLSGRGSVQRMWRTTQRNMDSIDRIVEQVGARDRQQLLLLSLTHYLEQKEP